MLAAALPSPDAELWRAVAEADALRHSAIGGIDDACFERSLAWYVRKRAMGNAPCQHLGMVVCIPSTA